jgi:hypothetical protein
VLSGTYFFTVNFASAKRYSGSAYGLLTDRDAAGVKITSIDSLQGWSTCSNLGSNARR